MLVKIVVIALLLFVLFNLFKALFIMIKNEGNQPMSKYLGRRVFVSAGIILLLLIAMALGYIQPNPRPY